MTHFTSEFCARCDNPKWWHILPRALRRQQDQRDDGHAFQPREAQQMRLEFGVRQLKSPASAAAPAQPQLGKKPPQRVVEIAQKKGERQAG